MKLTQNNEDVILSNTQERGEFRIKNSAKAFSILSSSLYSNKIKAIIRELSCNAYDSHVAAGKSDEPFLVHLPNAIEPYFSVTDFGVGLDKDEIEVIYTTYFESTKTDSNDFIGALGLGSKSPFSYIDNFTITANKNGIRRIYTAYINEMGVPSIALMSEGSISELAEDSEEGMFDALKGSNGVEVRLAVKEDDFYQFANESREVFTWFGVTPTVIGSAQYTVAPIEISERNISTGIHLMEHRHRNATITQGNIAYPLRNFPNSREVLGDLECYLREPILLEFAIGEIDVAASREEISYIPSTIDNIKTKLQELDDQLYSYTCDKLDAIPTPWERMLEYRKLSSIFTRSASRYFDEHDMLGKGRTHTGYMGFYVSEATKLGYDVKYLHSNLGCKRVSNSIHDEYNRTTMTHEPYVQFGIGDGVIIMVNDTPHHYVSKLGYNLRYATESPVYRHSGTILVISAIDKSNRDRDASKMMELLGYPPKVVYVSELHSMPPKARGNNAPLMTIGEARRNGTWGDYYYIWEDNGYEVDDDDDTIHYYVPLNNRSVIVPEDYTGYVDLDHFIRVLGRSSGVMPDGFNHMNVLGVRKSMIDEVKGMSNWVNVFDALRTSVKTMKRAYYYPLLYREILVDTLAHPSIFAIAKDNLPTTSPFRKFFNPRVKYHEITTEMSREFEHLMYYAGHFGLSVKHFDDKRDEIAARYMLIQETYPLIGCVDLSKSRNRIETLTQVIEYVKMLEKTNGITDIIKKEDE